MPGFPLGRAGHVTKIKSHGFQVYIDIGGRIGCHLSRGGLWAKMACLFYAGPSLGTLKTKDAAQKILEMILIEH